DLAEDGAAGAVEDLDVGPAAPAGAGDDVVNAVSGDVAGGHACAAEEAGIGVEAEAQGAVRVIDVDARVAPRAGTGGDERHHVGDGRGGRKLRGVVRRVGGGRGHDLSGRDGAGGGRSGTGGARAGPWGPR